MLGDNLLGRFVQIPGPRVIPQTVPGFTHLGLVRLCQVLCCRVFLQELLVIQQGPLDLGLL